MRARRVFACTGRAVLLKSEVCKSWLVCHLMETRGSNAGRARASEVERANCNDSAAGACRLSK